MSFEASSTCKASLAWKANLAGRCLALAAGVLAVSAIFVSAIFVSAIFVAAIFVATPGLAQSTTINHDSAKARQMKEPSFQTREERLNAKPLDWNSTIGTPKPHTPTAAERKALQGAKPGSAGGGAPNPKAEEEARKLHPDDWK